MANGDVRVDPEPLKEFTREVFTRLGVPPEDAATEAEVLLWVNLRGVDSHGVLRIRNYTGSLESGMMNATPNIQVENETPAIVLIEADRALGPVVTIAAMRMVVRKAGEVGVG